MLTRARPFGHCPNPHCLINFLEQEGAGRMPKYMYQAKYTTEGIRGVIKESPSARRKAVELAIEASGGKLEAFYYSFGADDVVAIIDLPDNPTAAGLAMNIMASGMVLGRLTTLLTVEEADSALGVDAHYRAPGEARIK